MVNIIAKLEDDLSGAPNKDQHTLLVTMRQIDKIHRQTEASGVSPHFPL